MRVEAVRWSRYDLSVCCAGGKKSRALVWLLWLLFAAGALADSARVLSDGSEALAVRLALIKAAKQEILISTFVAYDDATSAAIHQALLDAAARGVKVRYVIDDYGVGAGERETLTYLQSKGVDVRIYNPKPSINLGFNMLRYNQRQHDKLLVIDGEVTVVGGRNHWNSSFGLSGGVYRSHLDMEVLVKGKCAADARTYFNRHWETCPATTLPALTVAQTNLVKFRLERAKRLPELTGYDRRAFRRGEWLVAAPQLTEVGNPRFIFDGRAVSDGNGESHIEELVAMIDSAKSELHIESPYLFMTPTMKKALKRARERGVEVTIVTNSELNAEHDETYQGTRMSAAPFLEEIGVKLLEYRPEASAAALHSKVVVADGRRVYIGSFNFSRRSQSFNSETGVIFDSPALAAQVKAPLDERVRAAKPAPLYDRVRDGGPCRAWRNLVSYSKWRIFIRAPHF